MKRRNIFSQSVVRYMIYCYLFLAFTLFFLLMFGGGGHGPFICVGRFFTFLFCVASFPASLITLYGFLTGAYPSVVIPLLAISPLLNGVLIDWYLQFKLKQPLDRRRYLRFSWAVQMKLILRIIIFGVLFMTTVIFFRHYLMHKNIILIDILLHGWLFSNYMALLYLEIHSRIRTGATQKQIRWAGFHFTFWAGFFWGIFFASRSIDSMFIHPAKFFTLLSMFVLSGVIFGIVGMAITQFMVLFLFKQPEEL